jgi:hypothetical protein
MSSRFDPLEVTVWFQLKLEPLVTDAPPALGPTASKATPTGGFVVVTEKETVATWESVPLTPVIVSG